MRRLLVQAKEAAERQARLSLGIGRDPTMVTDERSDKRASQTADDNNSSKTPAHELLVDRGEPLPDWMKNRDTLPCEFELWVAGQRGQAHARRPVVLPRASNAKGGESSEKRDPWQPVRPYDVHALFRGSDCDAFAAGSRKVGRDRPKSVGIKYDKVVLGGVVVAAFGE